MLAMIPADVAVPAERVADAMERLGPVVRRTPLEYNPRLSAQLDAHVWFKREDLQVGRSYKLRGAFNLIAQLSDAERARGVVCASAGNHAQGVAFSCARLGVPGRIFVPRTTPRQKRQAIVAIGGSAIELIVTGDTFDDASRAAALDAEQTGAVRVPPFDDLRTIAGQGTVAIEISEQAAALPELGVPDLLVVPVGGGGLLAGIASWQAGASGQPGSRSRTRVVGVEPMGAPSMTAALAAGHPVELEHLDGFVDGAAVRRVGDLTFPIVRDLADAVVTVDEGRVCTEMLDLYQIEGIISEPAGALASAALGDAVEVRPGEKVVCIVSGGNNDVCRYGEVVERSLIHEGLKHYFLVDFPQEPGALRGFLDGVLGEDDDITLFEYVKKNNRETGPALVGVELARREDLAPLQARMDASRLVIERVLPGSALFTFLVS